MNEHTFTLRSFLDLPDFPAQTLLTPSVDPMDIVIRSVSVNEAPAAAFLRPGELVLTTAKGCRDGASMTAFFEELISGGAVAAAVSFESGAGENVPKQALKYAESRGFAVIYLPWEYRFMDIVEAVLHRLRHAEDDLAAQWERLERRLLSAYLDHSGIDMAANLLSGQLHARIVLIDAEDRVLADSSGGFSSGDVLCGEALDAFATFTRIGSQSRELGTVLASRQDVSFSALEAAGKYAAHAALPLLLWFDRDALTRSARSRRMDDILLYLSKGRFDGSADARAMAREIGFVPERLHACLSGTLRFGGRDADGFLSRFGGALSQLLPEMFPGGLIARFSDRLIAFADARLDAAEAARTLSHRLSTEHPGLSCTWGISLPGPPEAFAVLLDKARLSERLALLDGRTVLLQRDADLYTLLSLPLSDPVCMEIVSRRLRPLDEYEAARGGGLYELLSAYFQHNLNASETARALHFHRQSLLYKLARVESLLGFSLTNRDEAITLELCLRARRYLYAEDVGSR